MTTYDLRIARAWVDDEGNWWLSVADTDIAKIVWHARDITHDGFPGNSLGHRLIEEGWMPDRRAMYGAMTSDSPALLALTEFAGWRPSPGGQAWVIPCYRELEE